MIPPPRVGLPGNSATVIKDAIVTSQMPGKIGIITATIPYVDEFGSLFDLAVNFETRAFSLKQAGMEVGSGTLSAEHSNDLKTALIQLRMAESQRVINDGTEVKWVGVVLAVVGIIVAIYYGERTLTTTADLEHQQELQRQRDCLNDVAAGQRQSRGVAAIACPLNVHTDAQGRVCHNQAYFDSASPAQCQGPSYGGCTEVCN